MRISFFACLAFLYPCFSEVPLIRNGSLRGILTSKGDAWVEVKDDEGYLHRYLAPWEGPGPSKGGGFSSKVIKHFDQLVVGNRVHLSWFWNGHLRTSSVRVELPKEKDGLFQGYLLEVGDKWIDVQNIDEGKPWRFYLKWIGGYPENGGGYDPKIFGFLKDHRPTDPVRFYWSYDVRPRIERFIDKYEEEDVPFYEIKEVPPWLAAPESLEEMKFKDKPATDIQKILENKNAFNPFDMVIPNTSEVNPFDSIEEKGVNPFDSISPSNTKEKPFEEVSPTSAETNPFDTIQRRPNFDQNPFDASNPFQKSPFDLITPANPQKNPFDDIPPQKKFQNPFEKN